MSVADEQPFAHELMQMADADQLMRTAAARGEPWDAEVDRRHTARLREIVAALGWPTRARVGEIPEHRAWLLVQHADADPAFQRSCLELMRAALPGDVCPEHIAFLDDRVRLAEGRPQLYGTQLTRAEDGRWVPMNVDDRENLDQRRREAGLSAIADYVEHANRLFS